MTQGSAYKWSLFDRICNSGINFIGNIILVRLLDPSDFGLVAMVAIFVAVAFNFSSCGLSDGLIRKMNPTADDYSTVFVFNGAMGVGFGIIFILLAHPLASYFGYPELVNIMWAIGICFFFQTLSFVQETRLRKELEMKKLAIARLSSTLTALSLGIVLAIMGFGYWAIVSTQVFLSFFTFCYMVLMTRWIPKVRFLKSSFNELFGFGVHLMLAYVMTMIGRNINTFVLGKYSAGASGLFSQAQKLEEVPYTTIENALNSTFFVVLSNESVHRQRVGIAQIMHRNFLTIYSLLAVVMIIVSAPMISVLYGAQWLETIPIFRILCIYGFIYSIKSFYQSVLKTYGLSKVIRNLTTIEVIIQLGLLAVFFHHGILMIAWIQVIAIGIITAVYFLYYKKCLDISLRELLRHMLLHLTPVIMAGLLSVLVYQVIDSMINDFCLIIIESVIFIISLVGGIRLFIPEFYRELMKYVPKRFILCRK